MLCTNDLSGAIYEAFLGRLNNLARLPSSRLCRVNCRHASLQHLSAPHVRRLIDLRIVS